MRSGVPTDTIESLLRVPAQSDAATDVATWWAQRASSDPVTLALTGGFAASGLGFAFASGYQAALRALVPGLGDELGALCVSEGRDSRPRDMKTALVGARLDGKKTYVTLGAEARVLLVAAVADRGVAVEADPGAGARVRVVVAKVSMPRAGAVVTSKAPLPFVPELPHAEVVFTGCEVDEVLPGDGFDDYVKPFRTIEDTYVQLAIGAYLLRVARQYAWPRELVAELVGWLAAGVDLAARDPKAALTHIVLDVHQRRMRALIAASVPGWEGVEAGERARWRRDQPLLSLADAARAARTEAAWRTLDDLHHM